MTTKPTEVFEWASNASALRVATDAVRWQFGWRNNPDNAPGGIGEKPNLNQQNYWQYAIYKWLDYLTSPTPQTSLTGAIDTDELQTATYKILDANSNVEFGVSQDTGALSVVTTNSPQYAGGVYAPSLNRIYLMPHGECSTNTWRYIDCDSGEVVSYTFTPPAGTGAYGYKGGVYHGGLNEIFLVPYGDAPDSIWLSIKCTTGLLNQHSVAGAVANAYSGGVYSPVQDRIYYAPYDQANNANWHYISDSGSAITYTAGVGGVANAYQGGCYSPTQNRIYFAPFAQAGQPNWHYINCASGAAVAYAHGATVSANAYRGAVYSPLQNRIYFMPDGQALPEWHYVDCDTGNIVAYTNHVDARAAQDFEGGCYSPVTNRIYLCPRGTGSDANWYYIDCSTDVPTVVAYPTPLDIGTACGGAIYSPTEGRVRFLHSRGDGSVDLPYLQEYGKPMTRQYFCNTLFNSTNL